MMADQIDAKTILFNSCLLMFVSFDIDCSIHTNLVLQTATKVEEFRNLIGVKTINVWFIF